jgi:ribosomal protein S18 acetylase RimI-like enzyme
VTEIRAFTAGDVEFAAEQTAREGWASGRRDFELYLEHDSDGCFTAWKDGRPVGMVTTTRYPASGWIGNLIVIPEERSRGLGRALMERGLEHLAAAGIETVRLDGDPPGIPLYRSLGFLDEWESLRYRTVGRGLEVPGSVGRLLRDDLAAIAAFDAPCFGDDRSGVLRLFFERAERGFSVMHDGRPTGYLMVLRSDLGLRIGPCVAADPYAAEALLTASLGVAVGEPITVGVPEPNRAAQEILERLGFEPTPPSLRMVRGPRAAEGRPDLVFAIANGAVG